MPAKPRAVRPRETSAPAVGEAGARRFSYGLFRLTGGLRRRRRRRIRGLRLALLAFQLLARFVGAALQFILQLLLLLLEDFGVGRRTVIGFGEIGQRQHEAD